jgi:hypothetical protein
MAVVLPAFKNISQSNHISQSISINQSINQSIEWFDGLDRDLSVVKKKEDVFLAQRACGGEKKITMF